MLSAVFGALGVPSMLAAPVAAATSASGTQGAQQADVKFDKDSVVVYVGDKQLTDIMVDVLKKPEVGAVLSGFGNK